MAIDTAMRIEMVGLARTEPNLDSRLIRDGDRRVVYDVNPEAS
jgi:6-phosphogluconate dehydrogenase (decarboxylating)